MDMLTMKTWTESSKVLHVADLQGGGEIGDFGTTPEFCGCQWPS